MIEANINLVAGRCANQYKRELVLASEAEEMCVGVLWDGRVADMADLHIDVVGETVCVCAALFNSGPNKKICTQLPGHMNLCLSGDALNIVPYAVAK